MSNDLIEVIAVFDLGSSWKRFLLFDRNLHTVHSEEKIIIDASTSDAQSKNDLSAIAEWIKSCLKSVTQGGTYRILAINIAVAEQFLPLLEHSINEQLRHAHIDELPSRGHVINGTSASLIPYIKGSEKPFILVSTGTWCTFLNPYDLELFPGDQIKDSLTGIIIIGANQVKYSRFILGEIHYMNVIMLDDHFGVTGELYKTIRIKYKKIEKIRSNRRGRVFFRHGIPEGYADHDADLSHFLTYADAYHQMMYDLVDECLGSFNYVVSSGDTTEIIYVTGGFARNDTFVRILAARIPDKRVYASTIENATALGAAMELYSEAFNAELPPVYLGLKAILLKDD